MDLIIGAGNIGAYSLHLFCSRRNHVRLGARSFDKAIANFAHTGAEIVHFDFDLEDTYAAALDHVEHVFFIAPKDHPEASVKRFLEAAKEQGVRKIVFSSGRTTGDIAGKPLYQVEEVVRIQQIPFVILRPGWFMQNFLNWIGATIPTESAFYLPIDRESKTAFVDVRDIAEVAWRVCQTDEWDGQTLSLTSEEALTHVEVAQKISDFMGQEIQFMGLDKHPYLDKMTSLGWSLPAAQHMVDLYEIVQSGKEAEISPHVRQVLQRPPYDFDKFLRHHPAELAKLSRIN